MKTASATRRKAPVALFDQLESRQLMAVDLAASSVVTKGAYGADDLFDITVKLSNVGTSNYDQPCFVSVVLSKDTKLSSDDLPFGSGVYIGAKARKTQSQTCQVHIQKTWKAGDYYVITTSNPYNANGYFDKNAKNDVSVSKTKDIRIVTDKLADGATVYGTSKNDVVTIQGNFANEIITVNGVSKRYEVAGNLKPVTISTGKGNDKITCDAHCNLAHILNGGAGNDTIVGGNYVDSINGESGNDKLYGGTQADSINGGSGNDFIDGGANVDRIFGGSGTDQAKRSSEDLFDGVESTIK